MNNIYISPEGNPEVWDKRPEGYFTEIEWEQKQLIQKQEAEELERQEAAKPSNLYPARLTEVEEAYTKAISKLTAKYPDTEAATFYRQLQEARDYLTDSDVADVPFLTNAAKQRNMSILELAHKIVDNADTYAALSGYFVGIRHRLVSELNAIGATDTQKLLDVNIDFSIVDEEVI